MTRYFLHIDSGPDRDPPDAPPPDRLVDELGSDFADDRLALAQAALTAGELLRDGLGAEPREARVRVVVEDEAHRAVGTVDAALTLPPPLPPQR